MHIDWCDIFNLPSYFELHRADKAFYFQLFEENARGRGEELAVAHFSEIERGHFKSPARGTYGGIQAREYKFEAIVSFVLLIEANLSTHGAERITLVTAPFSHNPQGSALVCEALLSSGYSIAEHTLNYAIRVDEVSFLEKVKYNNRKRIKKVERQGVIFELLDGEEGLRAAYEVIASNRKHRGFPMTMTIQEIETMAALFSDRIRCFGVLEKGRLIAASICVVINSDILYVFYWGDLPGYSQVSPVAFLANGIYQYCQASGYRTMDIGTVASPGGGLNFGLMTFKQNLGFQESVKLTYSKELL